MSDKETNTEWSHLLGKGMSGPLKGHRLKPLITDMVTWEVWKKTHPDTTVLNMSRTSKNYTSDFYRDPSRFVFGFELDGEAWAIPMQEVLDRPVHHFVIDKTKLLATFERKGAVTHLFVPVVDDQLLTFEFVGGELMQDKQTNSQWSIVTGKAVSGPLKDSLLAQRVGIMSFRKAWMNFHPDSRDVPVQ